MRAIIIDDESDALSNFLLSVVEDGALEYKMFKVPSAALKWARTHAVDAAFCDIQIPEMSGVDLAVALTKILPNIRIVFVTGYTQAEQEIRALLGPNLVGFCYKPYSSEELYLYLQQIAVSMGVHRQVFFRTFASFDLFIDGTAVAFSSAKSKELLALLVDRNGATVTMGEAVTALWPEKTLDLAKLLWSDALWRLRHTLTDYGLEHIVSFQRGKVKVIRDDVGCDCWDFLEGKNRTAFVGDYMPSYDWSIVTQSRLEQIMESF